jgi:hypothetical protein
MQVEFINGDAFKKPHAQLQKKSADVILVMPYLDQAMAERCADLMSRRAGTEGLIIAVHDTDRNGFIAVANRIFENTESEYFGYVAQDAFPGKQWLDLAVKTLRRQRASLLAFNDGKWKGALAAFGLAERKWARNNYEGMFFFPDYRSHFADVELTVLAISQKQYCYNANAVLVEVDWDKDKTSVNSSDKALYQLRKSDGFNRRVTSPALLDMFC